MFKELCIQFFFILFTLTIIENNFETHLKNINVHYIFQFSIVYILIHVIKTFKILPGHLQI